MLHCSDGSMGPFDYYCCYSDRLKFLIGFAKLRLNRWLGIKVKVSKLGHVGSQTSQASHTTHMVAAREIYLGLVQTFQTGEVQVWH